MLSEKHAIAARGGDRPLARSDGVLGNIRGAADDRKRAGKVRSMLKQAMPERGLAFRVAHRRAGMGSLGRNDSPPSPNGAAAKSRARRKRCCRRPAPGRADRAAKNSLFANAVEGRPRARIRSSTVKDGWVLRRLAPYCSRIELSQLPRGHDAEKLLRVMDGTGEHHLGTRRAVADGAAGFARGARRNGCPGRRGDGRGDGQRLEGMAKTAALIIISFGRAIFGTTTLGPVAPIQPGADLIRLQDYGTG